MWTPNRSPKDALYSGDRPYFVGITRSFFLLYLGEREPDVADRMSERELALPDVAMELPSYVPDDFWQSGPGPSRLHPFGAEVC